MNGKKLYRHYMLFIGVFGQLVFYAQAYKIFTTHEAGGVSLLGFCVGLLAAISWFIYGILIKDFPILLANIVATIGAAGTVVGILVYQG